MQTRHGQNKGRKTMKKYEVPIVYRGQCTFIVEAETPEQASDVAVAKFKDGDEPDVLDNEWEEVDRIGTIEEVREPGDHCRQELK
jgi:hypothetical protein